MVWPDGIKYYKVGVVRTIFFFNVDKQKKQQTIFYDKVFYPHLSNGAFFWYSTSEKFAQFQSFVIFILQGLPYNYMSVLGKKQRNYILCQINFESNKSCLIGKKKSIQKSLEKAY